MTIENISNILSNKMHCKSEIAKMIKNMCINACIEQKKICASQFFDLSIYEKIVKSDLPKWL